MVRGSHDFRVGLNFRANQLNAVAVGFPNGYWVVSGQFTGDAAADLLTGWTSIGLHDQEFGGSVTGRRWKLYRPFAEDDPVGSRNVGFGTMHPLVLPAMPAGHVADPTAA